MEPILQVNHLKKGFHMSQNIRILVIEDEKNIQNFITSVLNSQHYQVISSLTGRDGGSTI